MTNQEKTEKQTQDTKLHMTHARVVRMCVCNAEVPLRTTFAPVPPLLLWCGTHFPCLFSVFLSPSLYLSLLFLSLQGEFYFFSKRFPLIIESSEYFPVREDPVRASRCDDVQPVILSAALDPLCTSFSARTP